MTFSSRRKFALLLASLIFTPFSASADELKGDRMRISLGSFNIISADTTVRFDSKSAIGVTLDTTQDLGMNRGDTVTRVEVAYRFNEAHSINLLWYDLKRSGVSSAQREFELEGQPILIGADIESYLNTAIFKVGYNYSFYHSDKVELAIGGGLHITALDLGAKGEVIKVDSGGTETLAIASESSSVTAPLPVISLKLRYHITPTLSWALSTDSFILKIQEYEGQFRDTNLNLEWRFSKYVGIGAGFNNNDLNIQASPQTDNRFALKNSLTGIHSYLFATF